MKEQVENLGWFSRMEELVEALEDLGLEVLEANREYVVTASRRPPSWWLRFGSTA